MSGRSKLLLGSSGIIKYHLSNRGIAMAAQASEADFVTVKEAAELLKLSPVTIKRWLKEGKLPYYHVGSRAVRIRKADLDAIITPNATTYTPRRLTDADVRELDALMERADALRAEIRRRNGGKPLSESWEIIREERDKRSFLD